MEQVDNEALSAIATFMLAYAHGQSKRMHWQRPIPVHGGMILSAHIINVI